MKYETNSRNIKPGQTFVAIKGHTVDGHNYINDAIKNGASAIVSEKEIDINIPVTIVKSSEEYLKEKLVLEYSKKLEDLTIVGVTGTNGKTTTCYLTYQLLKDLGVKVAYLGTIGFYFENDKIELNNTTPDILTLYNLLLNAKEKGCTTIIMEVSSHSLALERIAGLKFKVAVFTNLTEDHLDYHKTMEVYLKEKVKIVNYLEKNGILLVNSDDKSSKEFTKNYSNNKTIGSNGDYKILDYSINPAKTFIKFNFNNIDYAVTTNLTSKFNIYNYLTCLAIVNSLGYDIETIIKSTENIKAPKGRCETYEVNNGFAVIDYAHTPDAVEKVIEAYNLLKENRVITIIGCGGDRDPIKRPIMGRIATELSDYVILTSDNPRTEDPQKIMDDILKGISKNNYEIEFDRKTAIKKGIDMLMPKDILLILGKGHEDYQIIGHEKIHLDDSEEVLNWKKN